MLSFIFSVVEDSAFKKIAQRAGVNVNAQIPDIITETAIVIANCLYIVPANPPINDTGTKTAHNTNTIAIIAPETSSMAFIVASRAGSFSVRIILSTFSITTIASSTTIPIARTNPNNVNVLIEKPNTIIPANAPIIDTGTARRGINVARKFLRNSRITKNTSTNASNKVFTTSFMEFFTNPLVSNTTVCLMPLGKASDSSFNLAPTLSAVAKAFAPGESETIIGTASYFPCRAITS